MVDNYDQLKSIIDFGGKDDFIWVALILRKKDQTTTFGNKNNSARIIRTYNFFTLEQYCQKEEEIKSLCELYGCRAGVYLNKRNTKVIAHKVLELLSEYISSGNYQNINGIVDTAKGQHYPTDKIQFLDCDSQEDYIQIKRILEDTGLRPYDEPKILAELKTNSGWHIVTRRFDKDYFQKKLDEHGYPYDFKQGLQIVNPVACYYPKKNDKTDV